MSLLFEASTQIGGTALKEGGAMHSTPTVARDQVNFLTESQVIFETIASNSGRSDIKFKLRQENLKRLEKMLESDDAGTRVKAAHTIKAMAKIDNLVKNFAMTRGLSEATTYSQFNQLAPQIFDIVSIYYPNIIAHDICDIQQVTSPVGVIYKSLPVYSNTRAGVNAGDVIFNTYPTNGQMYASEEQYESAGTGDGTTTTFSYTMLVLPVRPGTISITTTVGASTVIATDTGLNGQSTGSLVGQGVASGTVNYLTGAISITYTTAPSTGVGLSLVYDASSESNSNAIPNIQYQLTQQPYNVKTYPLGMQYSVESTLIADQTLAIDLSETLIKEATYVLKSERDNRLIYRITAQAVSQATLNFDCSNNSSYSKFQRFAEIYIKIQEASNIIRTNSGRGQVDFIVAGVNAANVFSKCPTFEPVPHSELPGVGSYVMGKIDGRINLVVVTGKNQSNSSYILDPNTYIFGFKGMQAGDSSIIIADFVPIFFTPEVTLNLNVNRGAITMYDMFQGNTNYLVKGVLQNYVA